MRELADPMQSFRLDGRTALVTGARREIGRAIARAFATQGARVAVHHAGGEEEAQDAARVVAEIGADRATAFEADFAADSAGTRLADDVLATFEQIDILVLNASTEIHQEWTDVSREAFDRQIAINLRSTLELLQAL